MSGMREIELYRYTDFTVDVSGAFDNPFDVNATGTWRHAQSSTAHTGHAFYSGSGQEYIFRFGASLPGEWTGVTSSPISELDGLTFRVTVTPRTNDKRIGWTGRVAGHPSWWWGHQATDDGGVRPFVPILSMAPRFTNDKLVVNPKSKFTRWLSHIESHDWSGLHHPAVGMSMFDPGLEDEGDVRVNPQWINPNVATFEAIEHELAVTAERGGHCHYWMWGDAQRNQHPHLLAGGIRGPVHQRLIRYVCDRLGPIPGWSVGFGFDLDEFLSLSDFTWWVDQLAARLDSGWHHYVDGRYGTSPPRSGNTRDGVVEQDGVDWNNLHAVFQAASWEHWQHLTTRQEARNFVAALPDRPHFSEDRFRLRLCDPDPKDFATEAEVIPAIQKFGEEGLAAIYGKSATRSFPDGSEDWDNAAAIKSTIQAVLAEWKARFERGSDG